MATQGQGAADLQQAMANLERAAEQRQQRLAHDIYELRVAAQAVVAVTNDMASFRDAQLRDAHGELQEACAKIHARLTAIDRQLQHQQTWFDLSRPLCDVAAGAVLLVGRQFREEVGEAFARSVAEAAGLTLKQDDRCNWRLGPGPLMTKRDGGLTLETSPGALLVALHRVANGKAAAFEATQEWYDSAVSALVRGAGSGDDAKGA